VSSRFTELIVDCADPARVAAFWCDVLGWRVLDRGPLGEVEIGGDGPPGLTLVFVPVPEPKGVKNRVHIDVNPVGSDQAQELERLLALGARQVDVGQGDDKTWVVLADPEGNEFCLLRRKVD
jgi:catechol 2,3-dioxygenase-like lactoylglutathione lyase family enzyme